MTRTRVGRSGTVSMGEILDGVRDGWPGDGVGNEDEAHSGNGIDDRRGSDTGRRDGEGNGRAEPS